MGISLSLKVCVSVFWLHIDERFIKGAEVELPNTHILAFPSEGLGLKKIEFLNW